MATPWYMLPYTSPTVKTKSVVVPSIPILEGIFQAVNDTLFISDIAANITALPILLFHSRKNIVNAQAIAKSSDLRFKSQLAIVYQNLSKENQNLTLLLTEFTVRVPDLAKQFETQLNVTLSGEFGPNPKFSDLLSVQVSSACAFCTYRDRQCTTYFLASVDYRQLFQYQVSSASLSPSGKVRSVHSGSRITLAWQPIYK